MISAQDDKKSLPNQLLRLPLVPAQAVLSHDRVRDALVPHASTIAAPAALAVTRSITARATTAGRVAAIGARHEVSAHASTRALSHLSGGGDRAGTLVASALLAVATSDVDHSCSIDSRACDGTDTNANRAALDSL